MRNPSDRPLSTPKPHASCEKGLLRCVEWEGGRIGTESAEKESSLVLAIKLFAYQRLNPNPNVLLRTFFLFILTSSRDWKPIPRCVDDIRDLSGREVNHLVSQLANERNIDTMFTRLGFLDIEMDEAYELYPIIKYRQTELCCEVSK